MKTAQKYFDEYKRQFDGSGYWVTENDFKTAINEARKQAIQECAERATSTWDQKNGHQVDKQSILSLIDELK